MGRIKEISRRPTRSRKRNPVVYLICEGSETEIRYFKRFRSRGCNIDIIPISSQGILDIVKAYHDCGFEGYIRPDHGRQLWGEGPGTCRPGYGLYDRALGIMYMWGIWDMLDKLDAEKKGR